MINWLRLLADLVTAGCPRNTAFQPATLDAPNATYHTRPEGVIRIDWPSSPTPAQQVAADAIVQAHDGTPTPAERLAAVQLPPGYHQARAIRDTAGTADDQWAKLDKAAQDAADKLLADAAKAVSTEMSK